jgi:hypothetical protein
MDGQAIAAGALGYAGLGMLTTDFGRAPPDGTRLAEIVRARGDSRSSEAARHGDARAGRPDAARATRP